MKKDNKHIYIERLIFLFIFLFILFFVNFIFLNKDKVFKGKNAKKTAVKTVKDNKNHRRGGVTPPLQNENKGRKIVSKETAHGERSAVNGRKSGQKEEKRKTGKPQIAIVIDDFGYNMPVAEKFLSLSAPLTISVLPKLSYSGKIASLAASSGKAVLLHLPMESYSAQKERRADIITADMTKEEIAKKFNEAVSTVPFAMGVNNHEGSKATENYAVMEVILSECKQRGLFYLDSVTSYSSAAADAASRVGLSIHKRNVFLDNNDDVGSILSELSKLGSIAQRRSFAIGIGHARLNTALAVEKFYEENKDKFDFVTLDEVYK